MQKKSRLQRFAQWNTQWTRFYVETTFCIICCVSACLTLDLLAFLYVRVRLYSKLPSDAAASAATAASS